MRGILALLGAALVASAALAVGATAAPSTPSASMPETIVGVAASDRRFSTLVALVKQVGLVKTLSGKGRSRCSRPTNAAFVALKKNAPDTYKAVTIDKKLLTKVLTYHVLGGKVPSSAAIAAAKKKGSVKTVEGEKIKLSLKGGKLYLNGSSQVVIPDVAASNGVIHAINGVIVPPSAS